jgi:hypothetical protein
VCKKEKPWQQHNALLHMASPVPLLLRVAAEGSPQAVQNRNPQSAIPMRFDGVSQQLVRLRGARGGLWVSTSSELPRLGVMNTRWSTRGSITRDKPVPAEKDHLKAVTFLNCNCISPESPGRRSIEEAEFSFSWNRLMPRRNARLGKSASGLRGQDARLGKSASGLRGQDARLGKSASGLRGQGTGGVLPLIPHKRIERREWVKGAWAPTRISCRLSIWVEKLVQRYHAGMRALSAWAEVQMHQEARDRGRGGIPTAPRADCLSG